MLTPHSQDRNRTHGTNDCQVSTSLPNFGLSADTAVLRPTFQLDAFIDRSLLQTRALKPDILRPSQQVSQRCDRCWQIAASLARKHQDHQGNPGWYDSTDTVK